jgi:hypothetical protein
MTDTDPDTISVQVDKEAKLDGLSEQFDAVAEVIDERDELRDDLDELDTELRDSFDEAEHFDVDLDEDECPCEAVEDLVGDLDEKAEAVEDLRDERSEYREDEKDEKLERLTELGADEDEWESEDLDAIVEEIDRREEVLDEAPEVSVKDIESETDEVDSTDADETTMGGTRRFGRGHNA